jgi:hypothetical protein
VSPLVANRVLGSTGYRDRDIRSAGQDLSLRSLTEAQGRFLRIALLAVISSTANLDRSRIRKRTDSPLKPRLGMA